MTVCAGKYILRNFRAEDALPYYQIAHDDAVEKYVGNAYPYDEDEADSLVSWYSDNFNKKDFYFAIESQKTKQVIGAIIAVQRVDGILEVSAFVGKDYRRIGVVTTAMKAFISWLKRRHSEITSLQFAVKKTNFSSSNMLRKRLGVIEQPARDLTYNYYLLQISHSNHRREYRRKR